MTVILASLARAVGSLQTSEIWGMYSVRGILYYNIIMAYLILCQHLLKIQEFIPPSSRGRLWDLRVRSIFWFSFLALWSPILANTMRGFSFLFTLYSL